MAEQELVDAVDLNYVATWSLVGDVVEGAEIRHGHPSCIALGARAPFFNPAFFLQPSDDPEAALSVATAFFAPRDLPFTLVFREGLDPRTEEVAVDSGFVLAASMPGMAMSPPPQAPEVSMDLEVSEVTTPGQHHVVLTLMAESFELPLEMLEHAFTANLVDDPRYVEFLGCQGDEPICASAASFTNGVAGIYNVVTSPGARGRGLGAQMTWVAVGAARRAGCDVVTLQSSGLGFGVYQRMGFEQVSTYNVYVQESGEPN